MKSCPYCAEEIQENAIKCKHCGEWLSKTEFEFEVARRKNTMIADEAVLRRNRNLTIVGVLLQYFGLLWVVLGNMDIIPKNAFYTAGAFVECGAILVILIFTYKLLKTLRAGKVKRLAGATVNVFLGINIIISVVLILTANKRLHQIAQTGSG